MTDTAGHAGEPVYQDPRLRTLVALRHSLRASQDAQACLQAQLAKPDPVGVDGRVEQEKGDLPSDVESLRKSAEFYLFQTRANEALLQSIYSSRRWALWARWDRLRRSLHRRPAKPKGDGRAGLVGQAPSLAHDPAEFTLLRPSAGAELTAEDPQAKTAPLQELALSAQDRLDGHGDKRGRMWLEESAVDLLLHSIVGESA